MLEGMNDYLSTLPSTLQWISETLDGLTGVPWPLWIGGLFPIYFAALVVTVWILRGTAWPVRCIYPKTERKIPCRNFVPGEWHRCGKHNKRVFHRSVGRNGHWVDPKMPRWKQADDRGNLVDAPAKGVGFIRTRPVGHTLLYEHGYTRKPGNAAAIFPEFWQNLWRRIRSISLRNPRDDDSQESGNPDTVVEARDPMVSGLDDVVKATRFALAAFIAALLVTGIGIAFKDFPKTQALIYVLATLAFVLAWASVNSGIRLREWDWLGRSCKKSLIWWSKIFAPVAVLNVVFTMVN